VVNNGHFQLLLRPQERVRVAPLASKEESAETAQIVLANVSTLGVFAFDRPERRRGRKENAHSVLGDNPPESAGVGSTHRITLVKHGRSPVEKGP
jgi:hypothetical protein